MVSQEVVTPVKTGVKGIYNYSKKMDSGFRRNDGKTDFWTFYETIKLSCQKQGLGVPEDKENF